MPLSALPEPLQADQSVLIHGDRALSIAQLRERVAGHRRELAAHAGSMLALGGSDTLKLIARLLAAEGVLDTVYLLPTRLWRDGIGEALQHSGACAAVLDDLTDPPSNGGAPTTRLNTQYALATSGTTGQPCWHTHSSASLRRSIRPATAWDQALRWALLFDPCRFAGLQVLLQALGGGGSLLLCHDLDAEDQHSQIRHHKVNALSATPTWWRRALMLGGLDGLALRQITLGGEVADQALLDALQKRFPTARIRHIYASTEAGVGFAVRDAMAGFPAAWLGQPVDGVSLRVDQHGHLCLKPPGQESFIDSGDLVERRGERLHFLGRASGVINVGGHKVVPEVVEHTIRQVPGVAEARVFGMSSSMTGQLVAAEVVAKPGADAKALRRHISQTCSESLTRQQCPAVIRMVDKLAVNPSGKLTRQT